MDERTMLLDLKQQIQQRLVLLEHQIILSRHDDDDDEFAFLLKKAANFRDTLTKINHRLSEL